MSVDELFFFDWYVFCLFLRLICKKLNYHGKNNEPYKDKPFCRFIVSHVGDGKYGIGAE